MDSKLRCVFEWSNLDEDSAPTNLRVSTLASHDPQEVFSASVQNQEPTETSAQRSTTQLESSMDTASADAIREEVKKLRDENLQLRKENATLKEEGLRHRVTHTNQGSVARESQAPDLPAVPNLTSSSPLSRVSYNTLLIYAVMLIVCGFIIGKFIF
ncbi:vesicle-associated membrane protein/synaptobrevin-binding protein-like [Tropilaelaps mercedesae]|uniref:Vesicle-associated membrane protein/synaptobrevin-binding protein-like n=1 Tax=Tropilaelaps mercedesae TaxID=418985 RepID=A0A1V9X5B2_9ACAR|nr:vesicle-associated membrane protein/synaptobrevin-binding protein-like [Tropilaelaps mercedesae]